MRQLLPFLLIIIHSAVSIISLSDILYKTWRVYEYFSLKYLVNPESRAAILKVMLHRITCDTDGKRKSQMPKNAYETQYFKHLGKNILIVHFLLNQKDVKRCQVFKERVKNRKFFQLWRPPSREFIYDFISEIRGSNFIGYCFIALQFG